MESSGGGWLPSLHGTSGYGVNDDPRRISSRTVWGVPSQTCAWGLLA
jgi:hypothetical protein